MHMTTSKNSKRALKALFAYIKIQIEKSEKGNTFCRRFLYKSKFVTMYRERRPTVQQIRHNVVDSSSKPSESHKTPSTNVSWRRMITGDCRDATIGLLNVLSVSQVSSQLYHHHHHHSVVSLKKIFIIATLFQRALFQIHCVRCNFCTA